LSIADISVGGSFALALGTDGSVWGWGDDPFGELGKGPHSGRMTRPVETFGPGSGIVQVTGMTTAVQVSAGWQFSLAVYGSAVVTKGPGI
jgi:alpha-tubulin suppressor-like RCC1 family protein